MVLSQFFSYPDIFTILFGHGQGYNKDKFEKIIPFYAKNWQITVLACG